MSSGHSVATPLLPPHHTQPHAALPLAYPLAHTHIHTHIHTYIHTYLVNVFCSCSCAHALVSTDATTCRYPLPPPLWYTVFLLSPPQMLKWNGKPAQTPPNIIPANRSSKHAPAGPKISYSYPYILYTSLYSSAYGSQVYPGLGTQKQINIKR